jgi:hypothetical protein
MRRGGLLNKWPGFWPLLGILGSAPSAKQGVLETKTLSPSGFIILALF